MQRHYGRAGNDVELQQLLSASHTAESPDQQASREQLSGASFENRRQGQRARHVELESDDLDESVLDTESLLGPSAGEQREPASMRQGGRGGQEVAWWLPPLSIGCGLLPLVVTAALALTAVARVLWPSHGPSQARPLSGSPTLSAGCDAALPRTYCGAALVDKAGCEAAGCCWRPPDLAVDSADTPSCFRTNTRPGHYRVTARRATGSGWEVELQLAQGGAPDLGPDLPHLTLTLEQHTPNRLRLLIKPAVDANSSSSSSNSWEVPEALLPRPPAPPAPPPDPLYRLLLPQPGQLFSLQVCRTPPGGSSQQQAGAAGPGPGAGGEAGLDCVFSTGAWGLVFKPQYLQLSLALQPGSALVGLGETILPASGLILPRNGKVITLWNRDSPAAGPTDVNLYGSHPFFMELRQAGAGQALAHGVFLLNSNGMDVELRPDHLTFRVIGGVLDLHLMLGPGPEEVVRQYHQVIGRPALPPLWALGFHQSRYGYPHAGHLVRVVSGYRAAAIPLEVIWSDINYMAGFRVFTFDSVTYPVSAMRQITAWLHEGGMRWLPIQDPAVARQPGWPVWEEGEAQGVFVRERQGQAPYLGQVWSGVSAWPDFFHPAAVSFWRKQVAQFLAAVPADGLWLDMNEPSNFLSGECRPLSSAWATWWRALSQQPLMDCAPPSPTDTLSFPPYAINNGGQRLPLGASTLSASALHAHGWRHYDTHNLYALAEAQASWAALAECTGQRPFLLSRASSPGLGRYAAHWTGDNAATWADLAWAIPGILNANMWGMPLAGADICGFLSDTTEELCARWLEAGAFYPFSRNHADRHSRSQEATRWPSTRIAARQALRLRYALLPYLYTQFFLAAHQGGTVARALLAEWPGEQAARQASSRQWLLGPSVMAAPVLAPGVRAWTVYFPPGSWTPLADLAAPSVPGPGSRAVDAPIGRPPVFIRDGSVLPLSSSPALTTTDTLAAPLLLLTALSGHCTPAAPPNPANHSSAPPGPAAPPSPCSQPLAQGGLYADNGTSLDWGTAAAAFHLAFTAGCSVGGGEGGETLEGATAPRFHGWVCVSRLRLPTARDSDDEGGPVGAGEAADALRNDVVRQRARMSQLLVVGLPRLHHTPVAGAPGRVRVTVVPVDGESAPTEPALPEGHYDPVTAQVKVDFATPVSLLQVQRIEWTLDL